MPIPGRILIVLCCISAVAHAGPSIEGRAALGVGGASATDVGDFTQDESSALKVAAEGLVGVRLGSAVVGLHLGLATPREYTTSPYANSSEQVAYTSSNIYPLDLGLSVQVDVAAGFWFSAWGGATVSVARASSDATFINAIDYYGDIPAASWTEVSWGLGYGAALGYDIITNQRGRWGAILSVASQDITELPRRNNDGTRGSDNQEITARSLTLGAAYRY